jgi:hypothetical protein
VLPIVVTWLLWFMFAGGVSLFMHQQTRHMLNHCNVKKIGKLKHTLSCVLTKVGQADIASQPPGVYILRRVSRGGQNITKHQTMHRTKHRIIQFFYVWCGLDFSSISCLVWFSIFAHQIYQKMNFRKPTP